MNAEDFKKLPYTRIVNPIEDESGKYYVGYILEFDGCMTTGSSIEETYTNLEEAMMLWIETKLEYNDPIPEPLSGDNYSGKYLLRMPASLHKKLSLEAKKEGVSFNQYAIYKLSKA